MGGDANPNRGNHDLTRYLLPSGRSQFGQDPPVGTLLPLQPFNLRRPPYRPFNRRNRYRSSELRLCTENSPALRH